MLLFEWWRPARLVVFSVVRTVSLDLLSASAAFFIVCFVLVGGVHCEGVWMALEELPVSTAVEAGRGLLSDAELVRMPVGEEGVEGVEPISGIVGAGLSLDELDLPGVEAGVSSFSKTLSTTHNNTTTNNIKPPNKSNIPPTD